MAKKPFVAAPWPVGARVLSRVTPGAEGTVYHAPSPEIWSVAWDDSSGPYLERAEDLVPIGVWIFPAFIGPTLRSMGVQFPPLRPDPEI